MEYTMNKIILEQAIEQVKTVVGPVQGICSVCLKNKSEISPETLVEVIGTPTPIGVHTCRTCFDNIIIAIGEISMEY
jgi:hypothetical protein